MSALLNPNTNREPVSLRISHYESAIGICCTGQHQHFPCIDTNSFKEQILIQSIRFSCCILSLGLFVIPSPPTPPKLNQLIMLLQQLCKVIQHLDFVKKSVSLVVCGFSLFFKLNYLVILLQWPCLVVYHLDFVKVVYHN